MSNPTLATWVRHAFAQNWSCIRTYPRGSGHEAKDRWKEDPYRPTLEECLEWAACGNNVEVLLHESSLLQVDAESGAAAPWGDFDAHPNAIRCRSASGGLHAIYTRPEGVPEHRWVKPVPDVDILTKGVWPLPGCRREGGPKKAGGYWEEMDPPKPCSGATPDWVIAALPAPPAPKTPAPLLQPASAGDGYGMAALSGELAKVAAAPEGQRNETINRSAFKLGQLCSGGVLPDAEGSIEMLTAAGMQAGLPEKEARTTAARAFRAGMGAPRGPALTGLEDLVIAVQGVVAVPESEKDDPPRGKTVLLPGTHKLPDGSYVEMSNSDFTAAVMQAMPRDIIFRRDTVPGLVIRGRFVEATDEVFRHLCDPPNVRMGRWVTIKGGKKNPEPRQSLAFENCTSSAAKLIRTRASIDAPEIELLTTYPVVSPITHELVAPGYNKDARIYYAGDHIEPMRDLDRARAHLDDLIVDFPFEDEASRCNFLGLMLTPMLRPVVGKVPLHLVTSPQAGTGKSRLIEQTLGISYAGAELSSSQLPERQEERAKWLTALLLSGETLVHLDNLPAELDSGNLASLVTSSQVGDRLLGSSTMLRLQNRLTIAASGNNTALSGEMARRTVVVRLVWTGPGRPDERTDFEHPAHDRFVLARRPETLAALAGLVAAWARAGAPRTPGAALGSFEAWAGVVGGVLRLAGYEAHLGNRARWRERVDTEEEGLSGLVAAWRERYGAQPVQAGDLLAACGEAVAAILERPSAVTLGRLLSRLVDRTIDGFVVRQGWSATRRRAYRLEGQSPEQSPTLTEHDFAGSSREDRGIETPSRDGVNLDWSNT